MYCMNNEIPLLYRAADEKGGDQLKSKKMSIRLVSVLLAAFLSAQTLPMTAMADTPVPDADDAAVLTLTAADETGGEVPLYVEQATYSDYYDTKSEAKRS